MATYIIVSEDEANGTYVTQVEAKNMKQAATANLRNEETATIYRVAGPGKTVTAKLEQLRSIDIS